MVPGKHLAYILISSVKRDWGISTKPVQRIVPLLQCLELRPPPDFIPIEKVQFLVSMGVIHIAVPFSLSTSLLQYSPHVRPESDGLVVERSVWFERNDRRTEICRY